jgi:hypothetical protein
MDMFSKEMLVFKSTSNQNNTGIAVISLIIVGLVQALLAILFCIGRENMIIPQI